MSAAGEKQLRHVFTVMSGATPESGKPEYWDGDILWATPEDISSLNSYWLSDTRRKITQAGYESCGTTTAPCGAIVLTKRAPIGQLAVLAEPACSNQGCFLLTPRSGDETRFYYYWLSVQTDLLQVLGRGSTFMELSTDELKALQVPQPSVNQQRAIAEYLDRETARIDALIAAKERVLALLAEKRRALITRAVTRGLDPKVSLRDSGIPWLDEIPAHWGMTRLKHLAHIYYGLSQPPEYVSTGIPFLRATNVKRGVLSTEGLVFVDESDFGGERAIRLRAGDIIVVRSGAYTGDSAIVTEDWQGAVAGYDMVVRAWQDAEPRFIALALLCQYVLEAQIDPLRLRAAQPHLNAEELGNIVLAVPPVREQRLIVDQVLEQLHQFDAVADATRRSIILLGERRSAVIAAAVTGQIDVENAA